MIGSITAMSPNVVVNGGTNSLPYINQYAGHSMTGQLRLHNGNFEVYDGTNWLSIQNSYVTVGLSMTAEEAIQWAREKMKEEKELDELCKTHPALAEAYERLQILKTLVKQSDSNTEKG
jgi:hypothetical protein